MSTLEKDEEGKKETSIKNTDEYGIVNKSRKLDH